MIENLNSPEHVQYLVEGTVVEIGEAETGLDAEKAASHMKGYISALRYRNLIDHALFKPFLAQKAHENYHKKGSDLCLLHPPSF